MSDARVLAAGALWCAGCSGDKKVPEKATVEEAPSAPKLLAGNGRDERQLLVVMTADRGLCGGFNTNIVKLARADAQRLVREGKTVKILAVGKKGADSLRRDYAKCILCYKCVEACGTDAQNTFAIAVAGRGFEARISTELAVPLPDSACVYCGNCIGVCPTGALSFKSEHDMRGQGTWNEAVQTQTDTVCPYCGVGCTLTLHVQDDRIVKVTSPTSSSVTNGQLCIKGRFGFEFVHERKRSREP